MILDFSKLHAVLERIAAALEGGSLPSTGDAADAPKRGRGRPVKGETAPSPEQLAAAQPAASVQAATNATAQGAPVTGATDPVVEKSITLQQVADAIIDLANNHSRDAAVAILAANNVKKVPELKPEQFAGVLAAVAKAKQPAASAGLI